MFSVLVSHPLGPDEGGGACEQTVSSAHFPFCLVFSHVESVFLDFLLLRPQPPPTLTRPSLLLYQPANRSHGFAWADDADVTSYILPLLHHVKNVGRTADGGRYYGK